MSRDFERELLAFKRSRADYELEHLDNQCFALEAAFRRWEWRLKWNSDPEQLHDLRMERLRIEFEVQMLRIELDDFARRIQPLFDP